jgi:hypothetical protein
MFTRDGPTTIVRILDYAVKNSFIKIIIAGLALETTEPKNQ